MGKRKNQQVSPGEGWPGPDMQSGGSQEAPEAQPGPVMPVAGRLSVELDYDGGTDFQLQASDLLPEQPCSGVSVMYPLGLADILDLTCPCRPFWGTGLIA